MVREQAFACCVRVDVNKPTNTACGKGKGCGLG